MRLVRLSLACLSVTCLLSACATSVPLQDEPVPILNDDDGASDTSDTTVPLVQARCMAPNVDAPNTSVTYDNKKYSISFAIPYNKNWGYADSPMQAYVENESNGSTVVQFGVPVLKSIMNGQSDTCDITHSSLLTFLPPKSAVATKAAIENQDSAVVPNATIRVIGDVNVVQYTDAGLNKNPTIVVIGTKNNYRFATVFGEDTAEEWAYLEGIVKTVKLGK